MITDDTLPDETGESVDMADVSRISIYLFVAVFVFAGLGVLLVVAFVAFESKNRHLRYIKMSSPNMNLVISLGCLMAYASCVLLGLDNLETDLVQPAPYICQIRTWLLSLSFTIVFGSMLAKSWRGRRIFKAASIKRLVIRDDKLLLFVGLLLAVDLLMLSLWLGIDPLTIRVRKTVTPKVIQHLITNSTQQICTSEFYSGWTTVIFIYKGLLLIYGTYVCWSIRHVTVPSMNDSTPILISSYTTVIMGSFAVAMTSLLERWPDGVYASASAGIWIPTTVILCLVYWPKVRMWHDKTGDDVSRKMSMCSSLISSPSSQNFEQFEEEMYHLVAENRSLKKSLSEKDTTIKNLQGHVEKAKSKLLKFLDGKQDSGLDIDLSTSSLEHEDESTPKSETERTYCETERTNVTASEYSEANKIDKDASRKRSNSINSTNSFGLSRHQRNSLKKLSRFRTSIAQELDNAQSLSYHLRSSIHQDLNSQRKQSHLYNEIRSKQDLASAITTSYDLSDESDTYSYVSGCLRTQNYQSDGSICEPEQGYQRSHNRTSTLESDKYYPFYYERPQKKRSHRHWKRTPKPKVYTIQTPQNPCVLHNSAVAVTRNLHDAYDTFV